MSLAWPRPSIIRDNVAGVVAQASGLPDFVRLVARNIPRVSSRLLDEGGSSKPEAGGRLTYQYRDSIRNRAGQRPALRRDNGSGGRNHEIAYFNAGGGSFASAAAISASTRLRFS